MTGTNADAATDAQVLLVPQIATETRIIYGVRLPWQRVEKYGPNQDPSGAWSDHPPKGTVLDSGEVFVSLSTLEELAEQDEWDSQFGSAFLLDLHQGLALEAAGLAVSETRGGYHRSESLQQFIDEAYELIAQAKQAERDRQAEVGASQ